MRFRSFPLAVSDRILTFAEKKRDMFVFDPIAMLIVVAGVFVYFAFKGGGKIKPVILSQPLKVKEDIKKNERVSILPVEEIVENYRTRKERTDAERKDKLRYEWWLFKNSNEYERELTRTEEYLKD